MKSTLAKKLSQYSAVAGIIAVSKSVDAQIIYTDVNPDFVGNHTVDYGIDLNNDGVVDLTLSQYWTHSQTTESIGCGGGLFTISTYAGLSAIGNYSHCFMGANAMKVLSNNALISANQSWGNGGLMRHFAYSLFEILGGCNSSSTFNVTVTDYGSWINTIDKFAGIRVFKDSHYYYGWIRLSVDALTFTVKDYAINLTPDSSILAGQVDCNNLPSSIEIPDGQSISCLGAPIELKANVQLSIADSFQWFQNGQLLANSDSSVLYATSTGNFNYVVNYNNSCLDTSDVVSLVVENLALPVISVSDDTLFSSYAEGNQWFLNEYSILGATENFYVPIQNGYYQVEVIDSVGCSGISAPYNYIATDIQNNSNDAIIYFLDQKILHINLGEANSEIQSAQLVNELGVILQKISISSPELSIDMNQYPPGIYFVMIDEGKQRRIIKFALN